MGAPPLPVIARIWRGWTRARHADAYTEYLRRTGIRDYRKTPGHRGAYILRRDEGRRTEFVVLSLWDSMEAIARFAGEKTERAVFYPEDERYLVERETRVRHFRVEEAVSDG